MRSRSVVLGGLAEAALACSASLAMARACWAAASAEAAASCVEPWPPSLASKAASSNLSASCAALAARFSNFFAFRAAKTEAGILGPRSSSAPIGNAVAKAGLRCAASAGVATNRVSLSRNLDPPAAALLRSTLACNKTSQAASFTAWTPASVTCVERRRRDTALRLSDGHVDGVEAARHT